MRRPVEDERLRPPGQINEEDTEWLGYYIERP